MGIFVCFLRATLLWPSLLFPVFVHREVRNLRDPPAPKPKYRITPDKSRRNKMETDWGIGYYLGSSSRTIEHLIGVEEGIIKVDTIKRMADDVAYDRSCLDIVKTGYREYVCEGASSGPIQVRSSDPLPRNADEGARGILPRRARITPKDLRDHGYTVGCPGCEAVELGLSTRSLLLLLLLLLLIIVSSPRGVVT